MSNKALLRITREITNIQKGNDLSLAVAYNEKNVYNVKALIVGPAETPYEFGFYEVGQISFQHAILSISESSVISGCCESHVDADADSRKLYVIPLSIKFHVAFPPEYPEKAPQVTCVTTNGGKTRFNPNIYGQGKVCLSILGTWRGERGEEWSSAQGLESVLISIQSLMSANPYENEPGYENARSESDKTNMRDYISKIRHESLRISVVQRMEIYLGIYSDGSVAEPQIEPPSREDIDEDEEEISGVAEPFKDLVKRRFLWYYESYLSAISEGEKKHKAGESFKRMPFEGHGNEMMGKFDYPKLRERLLRIKAVLDQESTQVWPAQGLALEKRDAPLVSQLHRTLKQVRDRLQPRNVSIDLEDDASPFVWQISYFGRPMSNLDGAMFAMKMYISPRFPEEQPRIFMETRPIFHHRVAKDGTICYFAKAADNLGSHIECMIDSLEDENPAYDPRTQVNIEACTQYWGGDEARKQYNRQLRRSVQQSSES